MYSLWQHIRCELADSDVLDAVHARFAALDKDGSGSLTRADLEALVEREEPLRGSRDFGG